MSQNEKKLVEEITNLPAQVQDKLLLMAQGAAMALETIKESLGAGEDRSGAGENHGEGSA